MAEVESQSGDIMFHTDWSTLSPQRQEAFAQMTAEMEAERNAEEDSLGAS